MDGAFQVAYSDWIPRVEGCGDRQTGFIALIIRAPWPAYDV